MIKTGSFLTFHRCIFGFRTNGPVSAHLITGHSIGINIQNLECFLVYECCWAMVKGLLTLISRIPSFTHLF